LKQLLSNYGCPVELSLAFVGGKWRTVILAWLKEAPHRYGELRKRMPGLADKVLTQQLKELEALGLISKKPVGGTRSKPAHTKGIFLRKVSVSSTMGLGVKVDPTSLSAQAH